MYSKSGEKKLMENFFLWKKKIQSPSSYFHSYVRDKTQNFIQHVFNKKTRVERRKGERKRERERASHIERRESKWLALTAFAVCVNVEWNIEKGKILRYGIYLTFFSREVGKKALKTSLITPTLQYTFQHHPVIRKRGTAKKKSFFI